MRTAILVASMLAVLAFPANVSADHDSTDVYTDVGGVLYVDDDPLPYIYLESNGEPGLQRTHDDQNQDGHPGHDNADLWVF